MELQAISNRASQQALQVQGGASLASAGSGGCNCAGAVCNCGTAQQATQSLSSGRASEVQLSEQGRQLSLQASTDAVISADSVGGVADVLSVKPSAGLLQLNLREGATQADTPAPASLKLQQALRAYQDQQTFA